MICCDSCDRWCHYNCVGLTEKTANSLQHFICPDCGSQEPEERSRKRRRQEQGQSRRTRRPPYYASLPVANAAAKPKSKAAAKANSKGKGMGSKGTGRPKGRPRKYPAVGKPKGRATAPTATPLQASEVVALGDQHRPPTQRSCVTPSHPLPGNAEDAIPVQVDQVAPSNSHRLERAAENTSSTPPCCPYKRKYKKLKKVLDKTKAKNQRLKVARDELAQKLREPPEFDIGNIAEEMVRKLCQEALVKVRGLEPHSLTPIFPYRDLIRNVIEGSPHVLVARHSSKILWRE